MVGVVFSAYVFWLSICLLFRLRSYALVCCIGAVSSAGVPVPSQEVDCLSATSKTCSLCFSVLVAHTSFIRELDCVSAL